MSHVYERELKGILSGDRKWIEGVSRNLPVDVMRAYLKMTERPFIVLRAAGSFGVDLVAIRGDVSFPIEVKSSVNDTIHFSASSGRGTQQADELLSACRKAHLVPLYAYRMKRVRGDDPWRVFTVKVDGVEGTLRFIYGILPKLEPERGGHLILRWNEGMALNKFIDYLAR
ncbi:MAG: Holliday junction resolvase [Methanobacteriota archaeon]